MTNDNNLEEFEQQSVEYSDNLEDITQAAENGNEVFSQEKSNESGYVNLTGDQLNKMLHNAYLRGRNENIEARIDAETQVKAPRSVAGELLVKGLTGVAKAIFSPGRKSIWPPRRN